MLFLFTGKYYLADAGYPNKYGYLVPYKGERYHLQEFRRSGQPRGQEEVFNHAHSSLRTVIEYSMPLHNYIRRRSQDDEVFAEYDRNPNLIRDDFLLDIVARSDIQGS
jgi:hypothetical protein